MKLLLYIVPVLLVIAGCSNNPQGTLDPLSPGTADTIPQGTIDSIPETQEIPGDAELIPLAAGNVWEYWYEEYTPHPMLPDSWGDGWPWGTSNKMTEGIHRYTFIAVEPNNSILCERVVLDSTFIIDSTEKRTFLKDTTYRDTLIIALTKSNIYSDMDILFTNNEWSMQSPIQQCTIPFDNGELTIGARIVSGSGEGSYQTWVPDIGLVYRDRSPGTHFMISGGSLPHYTLILLSFNGIPYDGNKIYETQRNYRCWIPEGER